MSLLPPQDLSCQKIDHLFNRALRDLKRAALVSPEGELLALRYEDLGDIGTLGPAVHGVQQYLNLKPLELAIVNDTYCGGTLLSCFTLVSGLSLSARSKKSELLIGFRFAMKPRVVLAKRLDEEGVRIPPTPIGTVTQPNRDILTQIANHPLCPKGFLESVTEKIAILENSLQRLQQWIFDNPEFLSKNSIRTYLKSSHDIMAHWVDSLPRGSTEAKCRLDGGELMKLAMTIQDHMVHMNFSGTSNSDKVCLTHSATFGVAFGSLLAILDRPIPINQGTMSALEVVTSAESLLNAKYPAPSFRGFTDGLTRLATMITLSFGRLKESWALAESGCGLCSLEIEFDSNTIYYDSVPGGTGANPARPGIDGMTAWVRNNLLPSIEEVEKRFPLVIKTLMIKPNSGGAGDHPGGNGVVKSIVVKQPAKLTWIFEQTSSQPSGRGTGKSGSIAEIFLLRQGEKNRTKLASEGSCSLNTGDQIIVHSPGGGGYTKNNSVEK